MKPRYIPQFYDDVLQCKRRGEWLDFSTIKNASDAGHAAHLVATSTWEGEALAFRILRNGREVVLPALPAPRCAYRDCRRELPGELGAPGLSLSRADNRTVICSACGVREALEPAILRTNFAGNVCGNMVGPESPAGWATADTDNGEGSP